jgi:hypothetical protein
MAAITAAVGACALLRRPNRDRRTILRKRPGLGKSGNRAAPLTTMPRCGVDGDPVCVKSGKSMKKNGNHDARTIA